MGSERKKTRWPWILAAPVILLLAVMFVLKVYFTDERLRALIVPEIESATHRSVGLDDISFSFFPGIGITLSGFTLSNPAGGEWPHPYLLSMKKMFIDVNLIPLVSKRLEVNNLIIEEPVVYLDVTSDGRRNTSAGGGARIAGEAVSPGTGGERPGAGLGALLLSNMEITGGRVESYNRKLDSRWVVTGLHQTLRLRTDEAAASATVGGESDIGGFSYGTGSAWYVENLPVTAAENLVYHAAEDRLEITGVLLRLRDVPLRLTGSVSDLGQETTVLDLSVGSPELTVENLLSLLPSAAATSGVTASGGASFSMRIAGRSNDTLNPGIDGSFVVSKGTVRYGSVARAITGVSVDGRFTMPEAAVGDKNAGTLELRTFSATLGANTLSGKLTVSGLGDPVVKGSLRGNVALGEIREYYPLGEGTKLSGSASCDVTIDGRPAEPNGMRASGRVRFTDVSYSTPSMARPLSGLNGEARFDNQLIIMKDISMMLGGSDLKLDATLRNYPALMVDASPNNSAKPSLEFALQSKNLNTADLTGGEGKGAGPGREGTPGSATNGGAFPLPGIDMTGTVDIGTLRTEKFTFTNMKGAITVRDGVAKVKEMNLDAFGGSVKTSGSLDLRDPSKRPFDLNLDVRDAESNSMLSPFTTFGKYLFGKLTLSTSMRGDLNDTLGINPATLTGDGTALVANGKLTGLPLLEKLAGFLSAGNLREVDFKSWSQSFSVADGKLKVRDLKIGGSDASITVNGVHGLDGSIDYSMNVRIPPAVAEKIIPRGVPPALVEFFRDRDSSMAFDFLVSGQSSSPVLKLDTRAQEKLLRQRLGEEAAKKLSDPLKKAAEGLKKLIKP